MDQTAFMRKRRAIIALLLTITLPYSAVASIVDSGRCHNSMAAHIGGLVPTHHDHLTMALAHHAAAMLADHDNCECPIKCTCANGCGGGANNAAFALQLFEVATVGDDATMSDHSTFIPDTRHSPAFRPPITARSSAA